MILQRLVRSDGIYLSKGDVQDFWLPTGPMLQLLDPSYPCVPKDFHNLFKLVNVCI